MNRIRLHKEGYPVMVLVLFLLLTLVLITNLIESKQTFIHLILYVAAIVFYFFVVRFFRNPLREITPDPNTILSGADGTVVVIEAVFENEYFKDQRRQVSVFMSPTNVHVNWFPVSGKIVYFRHNQGSYLIASKPKSSSENERTSIVLQTVSGHEILIRQIAGTVARRIVCYAKEGKQVLQGDQLGIIKFGSRFDFFLPLDFPIDVKIGDKVSGNISKIAHCN